MIEEKKSGYVTARHLLTNHYEEIKWLAPPHIPAGVDVLMYGDSDLGKTTYAHQLCLHIASGTHIDESLPLYSKHKAAIIVSSEDSESWTAHRFKEQARTMGVYDPHVPPEEVPELNIRFVFLDNLCEEVTTLSLPDLLYSKLDSMLKESPADLIVVDALLDFLPPKAGNPEVKAQLTKYRRLCASYGCSILYLHHISKAALLNDRASKSNSLGEASIVNSVRSAMELRRSGTDTVTLFLVKGNMVSNTEKERGYELRMQDRIFRLTNNRPSNTPSQAIATPANPNQHYTIAQAVGVARSFNGREFTGTEYYDAYTTQVKNPKTGKSAGRGTGQNYFDKLYDMKMIIKSPISGKYQFEDPESIPF